MLRMHAHGKCRYIARLVSAARFEKTEAFPPPTPSTRLTTVCILTQEHVPVAVADTPQQPWVPRPPSLPFRILSHFEVAGVAF